MKRITKKFLSVFLSILMVISVLPAGTITAQAADSRVEKAINWAIGIANNDYYGYSQEGKRRNGTPDYDCSSLVSWAFHNAGFKIPGGLNTRNMGQYFINAGFYFIPASQIPGFPRSSTYLKRGDVLWVSGHTEIYIGNRKNVGAHANYNGIPGGIGGGRTWSKAYGKYRYGADEISVGPYWNDNWAGVYRLKENTQPPKPPIPNSPNTPNLSVYDVAQGKSVTVSWNGVNGATGYTLAVRGAETKDINVGNVTSYTYQLKSAAKYDFYVKAYNSTGASNWSGYRTCTAHSKVTVTFKDWDDKILNIQTVDWGSSSIAPQIPNRKGYTFAGWDGVYQTLKYNSTVKATYKINQYTVNFLDKNGKIIKSEKVNYNNSATPPTDVNTPLGYKFVGWNSQNYKNVFVEEKNKNINIQGIYEWSNDKLPIVTSITSAKRQSDGYYVYFDLTNYPNAITRGRAVVSLKTKSGKLVDMSESSAFSIPKDSTKKGMEVFIPSDKAATNVEVVVVDSYSSGVPISKVVTSNIDQGLMWSAWSTQKPAINDDLQVEKKVQYRYRDKEFSTGNKKAKDGWTWDGTRKETLASQSGWIDNTLSTYDNETEKRVLANTRTVNTYSTRTLTCYYHFYKKGGGNHTYCPTSHVGGTWHQVNVVDSAMTHYGQSSDNGYNKYRGPACPSCGATQYWFKSVNRSDDRIEQYVSGSKKQYCYDTYKYSYNFYRWKDWTDWNDVAVSAVANREVQNQTVYRYKSTSAATEDDNGKIYTISNKLDSSFAGKQITLYVYGYTGASDYTNEYIGQSTVGKDGSYSFKFKLREEPTTKTGDFTVAIGIEGATDLIVIDTIEAPKPKYTVNFYNWDGTIINTQIVTKGENAVIPTNPNREGYNFIGWDKTNTNIIADTDIYADFEKQEFTVVFVDWANQVLKVQKFNYGDVLVTPDFSDIEGYTCKGWDEINAGHTIVKSDMVVTAKYEINTYTVKFYDFDGKVIDTQEVKYGSSANAPSKITESSDGKQFAGWFNSDEYQNVNHDVSIYPAYYYEETVDVPTVSHNSGEYTENIKITLNSDDENAVIFYYLNNDETSEKVYTGPIDIKKTCSVTYYASSLGKNDSEKQTEYYCINSGKPSEWMLYSQLPEDVRENVNGYKLENDTGYRYKNTVETSEVVKASEYKNQGWIEDSKRYSTWSDWQDKSIENDSSKIGFEVATQVVPDPTVTNYQYSHYKYTDGNGKVQYSPVSVQGFECKYESIILASKLSIAGFTDNNVSYYKHNDQTWFKQTKVNGKKTQYHSRYQIVKYYMWTSWGIDAPTSNDKREYETNDVYRYTNKKYHIITVTTEELESNLIIFVEDGKYIDFSSFDNLEGHKLEGLYKNSELTEKITSKTPIEESMFLYANYDKISYTVVFQMQDGTELDTQKVLYGDSAVAPATDSVPGYVFAGWNKNFEFIKEDTVVTGKYVRASEYAYIKLNSSKLNMTKGTASILSYTITPSNLVNEKITWSTSNGGVATVDENGVVKAVGEGTAVITVTVTSSKEKASCAVTVNESTQTNIVLSTNSTLNYDSLGYLRRVKLGSCVQDVMSQLQNDNLEFINIGGTKLSLNDNIGTGTRINLYKDGKVVDTKTVIVTGDMSGDGSINNRDVVMFNKYQVGKITAKESQILAMDVNGDGYINNKDAAMIARYLVGKEVIK